MPSYLDLAGLTHYDQKRTAANDEKYLTKTSLDSAINEKLTNVYRYKGSKTSVDQLPKSGNTAGDVWDVAGGMNYAWDGSKWDALGESKVDITVDASLNASSTNPVQNKAIYAALQGKVNTTDLAAISNTQIDGLFSE